MDPKGPIRSPSPKSPGIPMQGNDDLAPRRTDRMGSLARSRRFRGSPAPGAGIPAGMRGVTFARVPGGVVASLLDHRLQAGKPPASWQMDAEATWDVATRAHAAVAHPPRCRAGTQPAATHLLVDRELPSSLRVDWVGAQGMARSVGKVPSRGRREGSDCEADASASRGVSEAGGRGERRTRGFLGQIAQARPIQPNHPRRGNFSRTDDIPRTRHPSRPMTVRVQGPRQGERIGPARPRARRGLERMPRPC